MLTLTLMRALSSIEAAPQSHFLHVVVAVGPRSIVGAISLVHLCLNAGAAEPAVGAGKVWSWLTTADIGCLVSKKIQSTHASIVQIQSALA